MIKRILPSLEDFCQPSQTFPKESLLQQLPRSIDIDQDQLNALHKIISSDPKSPPIIVNGSFGAGKTRLIAVATYSVIQHGLNLRVPVRVLICAHHHISADHLIEEYFGNMFRNTVVELARITSLKHRPPRYSKYSDYYITNLDYIKDYKKFNREHSDHLIVVTTFNTAPHLTKIFDELQSLIIFHKDCDRWRFMPGLLLQATYMLSIILLSQVGPSMLVLGEETRENGLKYSLLERLQGLYTMHGGLALEHMISLNTNYRCHKDLVEIPNKLFYDGKIKSHPKDAQPHPLAPFPLIFVCSSLTTNVKAELEAQLLLEQIEKFVLSNWPDCWNKKNRKDICLTTASQYQVSKYQDTHTDK